MKRVERIVRNNEAEERRKGEYKDLKAGQARLLLGDFRKRAKEIPDASISIIFTDPPYAREFLPLFDEVGKLGRRVLKPGGLLLTYSRSMYLPQIYAMLGAHLEYFWTCAIRHTGSNKFIPNKNIHQGWKPILAYYKPTFNKYWRPFVDIISGTKSKEHHKWEQSVLEAEHYLKALCPKNGVALDPMCGSGTTLVAGIKLGLECIGIEIDKAAFATAEERIKDAQGHLLEDCSEQSNIQELDSF